MIAWCIRFWRICWAHAQGGWWCAHRFWFSFATGWRWRYGYPSCRRRLFRCTYPQFSRSFLAVPWWMRCTVLLSVRISSAAYPVYTRSRLVMLVGVMTFKYKNYHEYCSSAQSVQIQRNPSIFKGRSISKTQTITVYSSFIKMHQFLLPSTSKCVTRV